MNPKTKKSANPNLSTKKYQAPKEIKPEHQEFLTKIGLELEKLRKDSNISPSKLCKVLGISRYSYYLITKGRVYFNIASLLHIISYFNLPATQFMKLIIDEQNSD